MISLGMYGAARTRGAATPLSFIGEADPSTGREKTITFPSVPLGDDFPGRQLVIAIMGQTDSTAGDIGTVTVGGNTFTVDITSGINRGICGVARGTFSGTSADVVLTAGASTNRFHSGVVIGIYHLASGLAPIASIGGEATPAGILLGGGGHSIIALTRAAGGIISTEGVTVDVNVDPTSATRSCAHISGAGPYTLSSTGAFSPPYTRICGVTYA